MPVIIAVHIVFSMKFTLSNAFLKKPKQNNQKHNKDPFEKGMQTTVVT